MRAIDAEPNARQRQALLDRRAGLDAEGICSLMLHQQPDTEMPDDRALLAVQFPSSSAG